jgi:hypothetical protein
MRVVERICTSLGMPLTALSTGTVTRASSSSGVRPGARIETSTCVGDTSGKASIGRPRVGVGAPDREDDGGEHRHQALPQRRLDQPAQHRSALRRLGRARPERSDPAAGRGAAAPLRPDAGRLRWRGAGTGEGDARRKRVADKRVAEKNVHIKSFGSGRWKTPTGSGSLLVRVSGSTGWCGAEVIAAARHAAGPTVPIRGVPGRDQARAAERTGHRPRANRDRSEKAQRPQRLRHGGQMAPS